MREPRRQRISARPAGASATRGNAAPALSANIERFSQFLTLVGLTALVVGGVGVANAVRAYLDGKRGVIATFKSLGASGGFVFTVYLSQILIIAVARHRHRAGARRADAVRGERGAAIVHPGAGRRRRLSGALALAGALRRAGDACLRASAARPRPRRAGHCAVSRDGLRAAAACRSWSMSLSAVAHRAALAGLAVWFAGDRRIALIFVGAAIFAFMVLRGVGLGRAVACAEGAARRARRALRLALGNIHRPGALTPSVVLSLGLGLTLLVDAGADRRQSAPADCRQPAGARAEFLLRRYPGRGGRWFSPAFSSDQAPDGRADARADAARAHHRAERRRCAEGRGCRRRAPGCCAATAASPMPKRSRKTPRWRRRNGGRRTMPASRWFPSRPRRPARSA